MGFRKAVKSESWLRLALAGPAGSGKTYTALALASELAGGKPVAVVDTERGSASKYADLFEFDVLELEAFHPDRYVEAIAEAATGSYGVVVLDSLSHAWNGSGGILELVEEYGKRKYAGNSFKAWGDVKPIENRLVAALTGSPIHVIATMRSKTEYVVEQNDRGKATPRKVGTAPVQRDGFEYEFDVFGEMTQDNELIIHKTRCPALTGVIISKPGKPLADTLRAWLHGAPAAAVAREPAPIATTTIDIPAPATIDPWAEVRELATQLHLSDGERTVLFAKHKKNRDKILAELRLRLAAKTSSTVDAMEAEADLAKIRQHAINALTTDDEVADLAAMGTVVP